MGQTTRDTKGTFLRKHEERARKIRRNTTKFVGTRKLESEEALESYHVPLHGFGVPPFTIRGRDRGRKKRGSNPGDRARLSSRFLKIEQKAQGFRGRDVQLPGRKIARRSGFTYRRRLLLRKE